eukprot:gnl/Dysnectes_brevis/1735_a1974_3062.p1 GENE.gnl/Dysnectes_brevis/1735_a1974_3062~~gnl/Dysnectes_brevis/1735_a1974_3062.p1  ORF type:complete len:105 (-),score=5.48 gnl/Dysnectes_brevis/1735_a1974_3062:60-374(-)
MTSIRPILKELKDKHIESSEPSDLALDVISISLLLILILEGIYVLITGASGWAQRHAFCGLLVAACFLVVVFVSKNLPSRRVLSLSIAALVIIWSAIHMFMLQW